ncbi:MAG: hypothetical protein IJ788_04250 [Oscillospiraceae bacterium]|nr:hypothetical protein [Oscillospiraceae bacterium]
MKKTFLKAIALCLVLTLALALASCGGNTADEKPEAKTEAKTDAPAASTEEPAQRNWTGFHKWLEEDWASKTAEYQFTGYWDMGDSEYGIAFSFLMNLYSDGSVMANQYQDGRADYRYFGSWEKVADPDGDELHINIAEETGGEIEDRIGHKYSYVVYEEADGGYSFGFDFGIAGGQYFRVANLTGSKEIKYASVEDFQKAAREGAFVVAPEPTEEAPAEETPAESTGYTATVALGDQSFDASLVLNDETSATFTAAVSFDCTYVKDGNTVTLTLTGEPEGFQAQIWPAVSHVWVLNDADMTMTGVETPAE